MKRSGFGPRKKPMSRGSWKTSPTAATLKQRSTMRRRVKKPTVVEGSRYLAACRGEPCFLRVPGVCCGEWWLAAVPCHSNQARDGKAMGLKAAHEKTVPGCWACHAYIDQGPAPREEKFAIWDAAYARWAPARARKLGITEGECSQ